MTDRAPSQKRWWQSHLIECACGGHDVFASISHESWGGGLLEEDEQPHWYLSITATSPDRIWDRLKLAWRILRGREGQMAGLLIDRVDLGELRDLADKSLAAWAEAQE